MVGGHSSEETKIATTLRLLQCGFGVAQGELNQQPECNSSLTYVQSNPISIDNKAFVFAPLLWYFIILYEVEVKAKGLRVNGQQNGQVVVCLRC